MNLARSVALVATLILSSASVSLATNAPGVSARSQQKEVLSTETGFCAPWGCCGSWRC